MAAFKLCSKPAIDFTAQCDSQVRVSTKMDKEDHGWWVTPIIPTLGKQRQDGHKFETTLVYIVGSKVVSLKLQGPVQKKKRKKGYRSLSRDSLCHIRSHCGYDTL